MQKKLTHKLTYHFQKQVPYHQIKPCEAHLSVLVLSVAVWAQPVLQAGVEALVHVSELRHLVENGPDLAAGQDRLRGPGRGLQSLHGLQENKTCDQMKL